MFINPFNIKILNVNFNYSPKINVWQMQFFKNMDNLKKSSVISKSVLRYVHNEWKLL